MNSEYAKLTHIAGEMTAYFLKLNSKDVSFNIKINDEDSYIVVNAKDITLSPVQLQKLTVKLSNPRQQEIEGYYWSLAGGDHIGSELRLVSAMTDLIEVTVSMKEGTTVKLKR